MKYWVTILLTISLRLVFAQEADSSKVMTLEMFLALVNANHPIAKQAQIVNETGQRELAKSRGAFDPKLFSNFENKDFKDTEYFTLSETGVKIPTWFGVELKASYANNDGVYLNPENNTTGSGLWTAGVAVPLGKGLFIDERRAVLKNAAIYAESSTNEQRAMLNELLFEARKTYWEWFNAYSQYLIYIDAVEYTKVRLEGVKQSFVFGDKPAIDTLEAHIQWQNRVIQMNEKLIKFRKWTYQLSNFLWNEQNQPIVLNEGIVPITKTFEEEEFAKLLSAEIKNDTVPATHPDLKRYDYKLSMLDIDRRWKAEKLKPKLTFNYNFLSEHAAGFNTDFANRFSTNNYKWGFNFSFPIPLREERNDLAINKLKTRSTEYQFEQKQLELNNKLKAYLVELQLVYTQLESTSNNVKNYRRLLEAEKTKFDIGESSVFLVNYRELALLKLEQQEQELIMQFNQVLAAIDWTLGNIEMD